MNISARSSILLGCLALALPLTSFAEFSGNLGVVSLYKDRGVDQEGHGDSVRPALQGGLDYSFDSGFYVGNWNSTGRFGDAAMEVDVYGGYRHEFAQGWGIDLGYVQYIYPGDGSWNAGEYYAEVNYQGLAFKVYRGVRENVNKNDTYYRLSYTRPVMNRLDAMASVGYQDYRASDMRGKFDYSVGLSYSVAKHVSVSAIVAGANRRGDVNDGSRNTRLIVGLSTHF